MEQAMQLLTRAYDTLSTVLIAASQAGKVGSVQANLQQAYAILQHEAAAQKQAEAEKRKAEAEAAEQAENAESEDAPEL